MAQEALCRKRHEGFNGSMVGVSLADLIQLKGTNRFSGCISVEFGGRCGVIFFQDGEIVHAEKGSCEGEEALQRIMRWPGGRFTAYPHLATDRHSIRKNRQHLLLDAHRAMDERHRHVDPKGERAEQGPLRERIRAIGMVSDAITLDFDGVPTDEKSPSADRLAAGACFLARLADRIGSRLGTGSPTSMVLEGTREHLFIYTGKHHLLAVAAGADHQPPMVEEAIRRAVQTA
ncbi:DUF4388 domain-containing protein [Geobacter sulfurreducens]|uniref:DUF4388 domain-containing protein n=1 Tax=Geobacter sulfurreducens TaxID=35554 RepID=UPI0020B81B12|nr:DUF4388 domain-containing protein [Geobacter sulfurreducens]UTG93015.1 DUF4388 domain-containing protein [Geobacter sulfurreducens]